MTTSTDTHLRELLGLYTGPAVVMVAGDHMRALVTELLHLRQAQRVSQPVVQAARHLATCRLECGIRAMEGLCLAVAELDGGTNG